MATKEELAGQLTAAQLRAFAAEQGIDVGGQRSKADLVAAVASGASRDALQARVDEQNGEEEQVAEENEKDQEVREAQPQSQERVSPVDTAAQAEAGQSAADLELRLPQTASGEPRIVKSSPETPTAAQVEAAESEVAGPPDVSVTVTDAAGGTVEQRVRPDDAAQISQRTAAAQATHPAHTSKGHYSNPGLVEATDEEREENEEAYAERVS